MSLRKKYLSMAIALVSSGVSLAVNMPAYADALSSMAPSTSINNVGSGAAGIGGTSGQAGTGIIYPIPPLRTYYVSARGSTNGNGLSWKTAWSGFDKIDWSQIRPGDTLQIDGGIVSMNYSSPLVVGADGVAGRPIHIVSGYDAGHDGQVIINGFAAVPLQGTGTSSYPGSSSGIKLGSHKHVWIQGRALPRLGLATKSIRVTNFTNSGISSEYGSDDIVLQNLEIDHNGSVQFIGIDPPAGLGATTAGDAAIVGGPGGIFRLARGSGVRLQGSGSRCDRLIVHNNGASNIFLDNASQTTSITNCWIYNLPNLRVPVPAPMQSQVANIVPPRFLEDTADGIHIKGSYTVQSYNIQNSVLGPDLNKGIKYFQGLSSLSVNNCLFIDPQTSNLSKDFDRFPPPVMTPDSTKSGASAPVYFGPFRMSVTDVTSFMPPTNVFGQSHSCLSFAEGYSDSAASSVFWGGVVDVTGSKLLGARNTQFKTSGNTIVLSNAELDPRFQANLNNVHTFMQEVVTDYRLRYDSPARGTGSRLTSIFQLLRM